MSLEINCKSRKGTLSESITLLGICFPQRKINVKVCDRRDEEQEKCRNEHQGFSKHVYWVELVVHLHVWNKITRHKQNNQEL